MNQTWIPKPNATTQQKAKKYICLKREYQKSNYGNLIIKNEHFAGGDLTIFEIPEDIAGFLKGDVASKNLKKKQIPEP